MGNYLYEAKRSGKNAIISDTGNLTGDDDEYCHEP
jgi:hypothetical protein